MYSSIWEEFAVDRANAITALLKTAIRQLTPAYFSNGYINCLNQGLRNTGAFFTNYGYNVLVSRMVRKLATYYGKSADMCTLATFFPGDDTKWF